MRRSALHAMLTSLLLLLTLLIAPPVAAVAGTPAASAGSAAAVADPPAASARSAAAVADPPECGPPVPSPTRPGYTIADPDCDLTGAPFAPLTDGSGRPLSRVMTGVQGGAAVRMEIPLRWNGDLVIFAHGYRGTGRLLWVDSPGLRAHHVARGFAWAASSYQTNGYDVGQGVTDSYALIAQFVAATGRRPGRVFMTGVSMGGHITAVAIEHFPRAFAGALPYCGVLGDAELFDYFLDVNLTAAALTGAPITFPLTPPPGYAEAYGQLVQAELPLLGTGWGTGGPPTLTPLGRRWSAAVQQRSGGTRPGFDAALGFWNGRPSLPPLDTVPFLFGLYPGLSGGTVGIADGNVTSNRFTLYQLDDDPRLSRAEVRLNRDVLRVTRTARPSRELSGVPLVVGRPRVPVLSLHTLGDLFVPFSMEQVYARRAAVHGRSGLFVSRAVRALGHCEFTPDELARGFDDLVRWVRHGHRPAGDRILSRAAVAHPRFGCRFTTVDRPNFGAPC